jgi:type III secretory pathway component EscS
MTTLDAVLWLILLNWKPICFVAAVVGGVMVIFN